MPATPLTGEIKMSDIRSLTTDLIVDNENYNPGIYDLSITNLAAIAREGQEGDVPPINSSNLSLSSFYRSTIFGFKLVSFPCTPDKYYHLIHDGIINFIPSTTTYKVGGGAREIKVDGFGQSPFSVISVGTNVSIPSLFDGTYRLEVTDMKADFEADHEVVEYIVVTYGGGSNTVYFNYIQ